MSEEKQAIKTSEELKTCPFCGGEAEISTTYDTEWIECAVCHARSPVLVGDYYDEGFMDGRYAAQMWNTREAAPKWVPCSERLPEKEEYVLLSLVNLDIVIGFRANTEDYWYYGGQYLTHNNVIAWMPLPEPYKLK